MNVITCDTSKPLPPHDEMKFALTVYAAGIIVGLVRTDGRWPTRIGLSVLWPLGPLAFIVTVATLVIVAAVALAMFFLS